MEPMLPAAGQSSQLEDLAVDLIAKGSSFHSLLPTNLQTGIADLVRSMNCYYSNLIEDHHTHPRDIDRALADDFSTEPKKRALQLEAKAHIEVQRLMDHGGIPANPTTSTFITWIHRKFCERLPDNLLWTENPDSGERLRIHAGKLRQTNVIVGRHLAPEAKNLHAFLARFQEAYDLQRLSKVQQILAVAASHHRLLWIHPFLDGNGRVARLFSHALLLHLGIGSSLWSVSRGLARSVDDYKSMLMQADQLRRNDHDGRGTLSQQGLMDFCGFFLATCLDQIEFMRSLLEPKELLNRVAVYTEEEMRAKRLPKGSLALLRHAILVGEIARHELSGITGYKERQARNVLKELLAKKLLYSATPRGRVRLGFPIEVVERWFPTLYPGV